MRRADAPRQIGTVPGGARSRIIRARRPSAFPSPAGLSMTIDQIRQFIQLELLLDETAVIEPDQDLLLSETLDSLSVTRLVQHLETEMSITIPPEDVTLENFQSLNAIHGYVSGR